MITANFATHKARRKWVDKAINSVINQVDLVRVYYNDYTPKKRNDIVQITGKDLTDRGKFFTWGEDETFLSCDDDILYPQDYVKDITDGLNRHPECIVSYHGRKLLGKGRNYYRGHKGYHCMGNVENDVQIDVPGTGVMAFNTSYFEPDNLREYDKMVDILIALEAKNEGVPVWCLKHRQGWIKILTNVKDIYSEMVGNCDIQSRLADELI